MIIIKRFILVILSVVLIIFMFAGCAELVDTRYENVEVKIVEENYRPACTVLRYNGKSFMPISYPASYEIIVEYEGNKYTVSGSKTYNLYKDKIGKTVVGKMEIKTYNDGTIKQSINNLKGSD